MPHPAGVGRESGSPLNANAAVGVHIPERIDRPDDAMKKLWIPLAVLAAILLTSSTVRAHLVTDLTTGMGSSSCTAPISHWFTGALPAMTIMGLAAFIAVCKALRT